MCSFHCRCSQVHSAGDAHAGNVKAACTLVCAIGATVLHVTPRRVLKGTDAATHVVRRRSVLGRRGLRRFGVRARLDATGTKLPYWCRVVEPNFFSHWCRVVEIAYQKNDRSCFRISSCPEMCSQLLSARLGNTTMLSHAGNRCICETVVKRKANDAKSKHSKF